MNMKKITASVLSAAVLCSFGTIAYAEAEITTVKVEPAYEWFIDADVNGTVTVNLPEKTALDIEITMDSNEYMGDIYYDNEFTSADGSSFAFDIEGRDNVEEDFRIYYLSFGIENEELEISSEKYTEYFDIPDGNNNANSWVNINYNVSVEVLDTEEAYSVTRTETATATGKDINVDITFYVYYMPGDVNGDTLVTAVDAATVLAEYASTATSGEPTFTVKQFEAADINNDGVITASDAGKILAYYAELQAKGEASWT